MKTIKLYSTQGCHLCDDARALLWPLLTVHDYQLEEVEITDSEELMALYGISIPVLEEPAKKEKLFWPFDQVQVNALLSE